MAEIEIQEIKQKDKPLTFWMKFAGTLCGSILIAFAIIFIVDSLLDSPMASDRASSITARDHNAKEENNNPMLEEFNRINDRFDKVQKETSEDTKKMIEESLEVKPEPKEIIAEPQRPVFPFRVPEQPKNSNESKFSFYPIMLVSIFLNLLFIVIIGLFFEKLHSINLKLIDMLVKKECDSKSDR